MRDCNHLYISKWYILSIYILFIFILMIKLVSFLCIYIKYRNTKPVAQRGRQMSKGRYEVWATWKFLWKVFRLGVSWKAHRKSCHETIGALPHCQHCKPSMALFPLSLHIAQNHFHSLELRTEVLLL